MKRALSSDDDDGGQWMVATSRRKKKPQPRTQPATSPSSSSSSSRPWFSVLPNDDFPLPYLVVKKLEEAHQLRFTVKPGASGLYVQPEDDRSLRILSETTVLDGRRLHLVQRGAPSLRKAVVCGFHQFLGLDLLDRVEGLSSPERLKTRSGVETKQVCVFFKGAIPKYIDLGNWGRFSVRPFTPEPLRCFRCQMWGHPQGRCSNPAKCGVCSGAHDTSVCFQKHREQQATTACCPNCGGKHHAWNLSCPSRKAQVAKMGREKPTAEGREKPKARSRQQQRPVGGSSSSGEVGAETVETPTPPRKRRRRRKRKSKAKTSQQQQPPPPQPRPRSTMRPKISLTGDLVSRSTGVDTGVKQTLPTERLRPLLLSLAKKVAEASSCDISELHLEGIVDNTLASQGLDVSPNLHREPEIPEGSPHPEPRGPPPPPMEEEEFSGCGEEDDAREEASEDGNGSVTAMHCGDEQELAEFDLDRFMAMYRGQH